MAAGQFQTTAIYNVKMGGADQYAQDASKVSNANKKIADGAAQVAQTEERVTQANRVQAESFAKLEARYEKNIKLEQQRNAALQQAKRFLDEGAISQERYGAQVNRVNAHFDRIGLQAGKASAGVRAVNAAGLAANQVMFGMAARLGPVGFALSALGPAGLAAGAALGLGAGLAAHAIEGAGALGELAEQLGVTTHDLQAFQYQAVQNGVSTGELEATMAKFTATIGEAAGGNKTAIETFDKLGVKILDAGGKTRSTHDVYVDVADAIQEMTDATQQAAIARDLFGRGGQKLIPILKQGAEGFSATAAEAERLGIILSQDAIDAADDASDAMDRLGFRVNQMGLKFGAALAGPLTGFLDWAADVEVELTPALRKIQEFYDSLDVPVFLRPPALVVADMLGLTGDAAPPGGSGAHPRDFAPPPSHVVTTYVPGVSNPPPADTGGGGSSAQSQAEMAAKAAENATAALDAYIAALKEEQAQLARSERERAIRNAELQAEQIGMKGNVANLDEYIARTKAEAAALFDAEQALKKKAAAEDHANGVIADAARIQQQALTPLEIYAQTVARLNADLAAGAISQDRWNRGVAAAGVVLENAKDAATAAEDAMGGLVSTTVDWAVSLGSAGELMNTLQDQLLRLLATASSESISFGLGLPSSATATSGGLVGLFDGLLGLFGSSFYTSTAAGQAILPTIFHGGGIANENNAPARPVSASIFDQAPRLHDGYAPNILPGEMPAILERDKEAVIPLRNGRVPVDLGDQARGGSTIVQNNYFGRGADDGFRQTRMQQSRAMIAGIQRAAGR